MRTRSFKVSGRELPLPSHQRNQTTLEIDSVPRKYFLRRSTLTPAEEISRYLAVNSKNILLVDAKVWKTLAKNISISPKRLIIVEASEQYKSLQHGVLPLVDALMAAGISKSEQLIVVGGGIVQEVAAFAACIYRRGIPWVLFPTTLLSMSDSCIGGKAAVNYAGAKNQLALYYSPKEVILCSQFLETLPGSEISSGLGEIFKSCLLGGDDCFAEYRTTVGDKKTSSDITVLTDLAWLSLLIKKTIVETDEFESDLRRVLNYGHTLGHVIESLSNYIIPHGFAIVAGILIVNKMAVHRGLLSPENEALIRQHGQTLISDHISELAHLNLDALAKFLSQDKKNEGQDLTFVMLKTPGESGFQKIANNDALHQEIQAIYRHLFRSSTS